MEECRADPPNALQASCEDSSKRTRAERSRRSHQKYEQEIIRRLRNLVVSLIYHSGALSCNIPIAIEATVVISKIAYIVHEAKTPGTTEVRYKYEKVNDIEISASPESLPDSVAPTATATVAFEHLISLGSLVRPLLSGSSIESQLGVSAHSATSAQTHHIPGSNKTQDSSCHSLEGPSGRRLAWRCRITD